MKIIDNTSLLLGDDLKATLGRGARIKIAASCFSIYAFEALKADLEQIESLEFIFTSKPAYYGNALQIALKLGGGLRATLVLPA